MAARGRPVAAVVLDADTRDVLQRWARRPSSAQALALRCKIVLAAADGLSNTEIAAKLDCHKVTVGKWRARFVVDGLDGLWDDPRPGAPRRISDADVERVVVATLEQTPRDATHWSTRSMAAATGMSDRDEPVRSVADLAGVWAQAAHGGVVQAVAGSAVHRQGP